MFGVGDGNATVNLNGGGTLALASGIVPGGVGIQTYSNGDVMLGIAGTADRITVHNDAAHTAFGSATQLSNVVFADGTTWNQSQIGAHSAPKIDGSYRLPG